MFLYGFGGLCFVCGVSYLIYIYLGELYCPVPIINLQEMNWNYASNSQQQNVPPEPVLGFPVRNESGQRIVIPVRNEFVQPIGFPVSNFSTAQEMPYNYGYQSDHDRRNARYRRNVQNG